MSPKLANKQVIRKTIMQNNTSKEKIQNYNFIYIHPGKKKTPPFGGVLAGPEQLS